MALARFLSVFLVFSSVTIVISVESSLKQNANVVYSRWVRRRPVGHHKNIYFDEVREVFHTRRRPPPFAFLNDETLTRFVRCDYDPSLPDCDESGVRTTSVKPESASTFRTTTSTRATTTTMAPSITSTTRSPWIYTTRTTVRTPWRDAPTTTSTTSTTSITSTTPPTTSTTPSTTSTTPSTTTTPISIPERPEAPTTEELPLLPDIEDDNEDDYNENADSPTSNIEEEDHKKNVDYLNYDANEVDEEDDDYLTEDNEVEEADADPDIVESAALTQETTTAKSKSLFSWF